MEKDVVKSLLDSVTPGTLLRLKYEEKDTTIPPLYLIGMANEGVIEFVKAEYTILNIFAVAESGTWGKLLDRVIEIKTTVDFDLEWFLDRVAWPLESLEVIPPN